jgi:hypothetical protein
MVAALYVQTDGCYFGLPDVDPWDIHRDARGYAGPHAIVAHPPCQRWGRYWFGGPSAKQRRIKGDDGGCFAAALAAVNHWGGVLEHPESSHAWRAFNIVAPPKDGGWVRAGMFQPGWTCCVEQGHYGHRARKATWLYAFGVDPPELKWGPSKADHRVDGCVFHTREERIAKLGTMTRRQWLRHKGIGAERMGKSEREQTPPEFRDLLLSLARTANRRAA